jgi:hypothetical protein
MLAVTFPQGFDGKNATGTIQLYKPDNAKLDQVIDLELNEANQHLIDQSSLIQGRWDIKVAATLNDKLYYWEESINL